MPTILEGPEIEIETPQCAASVPRVRLILGSYVLRGRDREHH